MIDFHSHLMPGVDDGATDIDESRAALSTLRDQGVRALITTPHLSGTLLSRPVELAKALARMDRAWEELSEVAVREFPELRVMRGAEIALDAPEIDVSDVRARLAGTSFVLVEFPHMSVPPNSANALFELRMKGWNPIIAHPERYLGVDSQLGIVEDRRRVGGLLQVNCGSLLGRYGGQASETAWRLLRRGWVDYLSSDYHARGKCAVAEARAKLVEKGGEEQARLLMEVNPELLLAGERPRGVPPLEVLRKSWWQRAMKKLGSRSG